MRQAEESHHEQVEAQLAKDAFAWVIDPIDGTRNFLHCLPNVSVAIGIVRAGEAVAGVVHAPVFDETFTASAGRGALLNGQPIRVSGVRELREAAVGTDVNSRQPELLDRTLGGWRALLLANTQNVRIRGSAALEICSVAAGRLDGERPSGIRMLAPPPRRAAARFRRDALLQSV